MVEPVDIARRMADPDTYEDTIMRIFTKKRQRGAAFADITEGITYFDTATNRRSLAKAIAHDVSDGTYRPQPVTLWELETRANVAPPTCPPSSTTSWVRLCSR